MNSVDKVIFQGVTYHLPSGHTEAEIRAALSEQAPAIANASLNTYETPDGVKVWDFSEKAGTKG